MSSSQERVVNRTDAPRSVKTALHGAADRQLLEVTHDRSGFFPNGRFIAPSVKSLVQTRVAFPYVFGPKQASNENEAVSPKCFVNGFAVQLIDRIRTKGACIHDISKGWYPRFGPWRSAGCSND